jgi:hypothetical protein
MKRVKEIETVSNGRIQMTSRHSAVRKQLPASGEKTEKSAQSQYGVEEALAQRQVRGHLPEKLCRY